MAKPCCFHEHYHGLDHAHPISLFAVSGPSLLAFKYKTCKSMASAYQLWQPAALSQLRGGPRRQLYTIGSKDENVCQSEPKCVSSFFKQCRIKYKKSMRMDWNTPNPKASLFESRTCAGTSIPGTGATTTSSVKKCSTIAWSPDFANVDNTGLRDMYIYTITVSRWGRKQNVTQHDTFSLHFYLLKLGRPQHVRHGING